MSELQLAMCVNVGSLTVGSELGNEDSFKRETDWPDTNLGTTDHQEVIDEGNRYREN